MPTVGETPDIKALIGSPFDSSTLHITIAKLNGNNFLLSAKAFKVAFGVRKKLKHIFQTILAFGDKALEGWQ